MPVNAIMKLFANKNELEVLGNILVLIVGPAIPSIGTTLASYASGIHTFLATIKLVKFLADLALSLGSYIFQQDTFPTVILQSVSSVTPAPTQTPTPSPTPSPTPTMTPTSIPTLTASPTSTPAVLSVNPGSINANTDCTWDVAYAWGCQVTLSNTANTQSSLNWSSSSSNISTYIVAFTPSNGTLQPGQSVNVGIIVGTSNHSTCQQGGVNGTLIFTGTTNTVTVPWSCTLPILSAIPTSINGDTGCSHSPGGPWSCSVTLTQQSPGATYWYASSDNSNIFPDPTGGFLGGPGASVTVPFTVPSMACPAKANIFFSGGATTLTVPWSCATG